MKRIISIIVLVATLLTMTAIFASCGTGQSVPESTSWKEIDASGKVKWKYDNQTYTLSIQCADNTTTAPMFNDKKFNETVATDMPWDYLRNYIYEVRLENVTDVPAYAFYSMPALKHVEFEKDQDNDVKSIGKCAFAFCRSLSLADVSKTDSSEPIVLPEGITYIGDSAFEGCSSLTKITLPSTLVNRDENGAPLKDEKGNVIVSFGDKVFAYCYNLKDVVKAKALTTPANTFALLNGVNNVKLTNHEDIKAPEETTPSTPSTPTDTETKAPESESATDSNKATDSKPSEDKVTVEEESNTTTMVIGLSIFGVVIVGLVIGGILLYRSNKKQTKDARTVRKNDNEKTDEKKDDKNANNKNNKNGKNAKKGKKK